MNSTSFIYILLAVTAAFLLSFFQYFYKTKQIRFKAVYALLRFITYLSLLVLLINPKFEAVSYYEERPNLVLAIDNSESISYLKQDKKTKKATATLLNNKALTNKFNLQSFTFGNAIKSLDTLSFNERQTNFTAIFKMYNELFGDKTAPILLITDGNQTIGNDYEYVSKQIKQPIFPVIIGDTTTYSDLKIKQINSNRYAYLKNSFPVEIFVDYTGVDAVNTNLKIMSGNTTLFNKSLQFSSDKTSEIISTSLNATSVGVKSYNVEVSPLSDEKNSVNNSKKFAVEVIDQKSNIAIVSEQLHPDLGAIKKAIETNEQRNVSILNLNEFIQQNTDYQLVIVYQPNKNFENVFSKLETLKANTFIITGKSTDWAFLNSVQNFYVQKITNQTEDYQPALNTGYGNFIIDNISFLDYPPLVSEFGSIAFKTKNDIILYKTINGNLIDAPMLCTMEFNGQKHALLNGEGIWRWRAQNFLDTDTFEDFDTFIGKLVQYLSSTKKRERLKVDYKSFYNGNESITIHAQFFNKSFEFDKTANLEIILEHKANRNVRSIPLLLGSRSYSVDLSGIDSGDYRFTIKNKNEPISLSGEFKILDYNVEQQFLNANLKKLKAVSKATNGKLFVIDDITTIIESLVNDDRFKTIQKSKTDTIPLIDYKYLLGLIALALSLEWFIRKYNGLI